MKNIFKSLLVAFAFIAVSLNVSATDATFTMKDIFNGSNMSADVTTPVAASVSTTASKSNAKNGTLGSTNNYFEIILQSETFSAASINGFINTNNTGGNNKWGFQFSTDKGATWGEQQSQPNDGNKTAHDIAVEVTIPENANGFRVIRLAGTSTVVNSITLTLDGSGGGGGDEKSHNANLAYITVFNLLDESIIYPLSPAFSPDITEYTCAIPAETAWSGDAKQEDENATIGVDYSGIDPSTMYGDGKIIVTAEDGVTTKTYTIHIVPEGGGGEEEKSHNANLASITVFSLQDESITYPLSPAFSPNITEYTCVIPAETPWSGNVQTEDENASWAPDFSGIDPSTYYGDGKIIVTAEDGVTTKTYTIHIVPEGGGEEPPASGKYEEIIRVELSGSNASTQTVTGTIGGTSEVNKMGSSSPYKLNSDGAYVSAVLASGFYEPTDTLYIDGSKKMLVYYGPAGSGTELLTTDAPENGIIKTPLKGLPSGQNSIYVYRTSSTYNGTLTYLSVHRPSEGGGGGEDEKSHNANLANITIKSADGTIEYPLLPAFDPDVLEYTCNSPMEEYRLWQIDVQKEDENASVDIKWYDEHPQLYETKAKFIVTAEDGVTQKNYIIYFISTAPRVTSVTWDNILGTASISEYDPTITGQVESGSSLTLAISFEGNNIDHWTPTEPQDFSQGPVDFTLFNDQGEEIVYTVTITEASAVSSDATLKSLTYGGKTVPGFSPSTYVYNIELTAGIKTPPEIAAVANDANAHVDITQATSVPGSGKVVVTAEDGLTKLTYTINYSVPVSPSGLSTHVPEIYEAKTLAGGYGGQLAPFGGREYETYYAGKTKDGDMTVDIKPNQKMPGIAIENSGTSCKAPDGWFEAATTSISNYTNTKIDEFVDGTGSVHKMQGCSYKMRVQGFDQISILAADKNVEMKDGAFKKEQRFQIFIDDVMQPEDQASTSTTVRRYDISTGAHEIEIRALSGGASLFYGFSLRVANEPRTKYIKGNDSAQVVFQTQAIKPVIYATKYNNVPGAETKLEWLGPKATDIDLVKTEGTLSDTLTLSGIANCPTGEYKYAVVAYYNGMETSRATGKFIVESDIRSTTDIVVTVFNGEEMDPIKFKYFALKASDVKLTWGENGKPAGVNDSGANGIYTIGGTPNLSGTFPQSFPYEITVIGADTIIKGKITIKELVHTDKDVLFLYKNTEKYNTQVYDDLQTAGWNPIERRTLDDLRSAEQYSYYKWILISEDVDANNPEVLAIARGEVNLPVLNMKSFTYTPDRLDWGEPDNGSLSQEEGRFITVWREDHPIFKSLNKKHGDRIQMLDTVIGRGLMPVAVDLENTFCLATARTRDRDVNNYYGDGPAQTFLHEIPVSERPNGKKYICMPIAVSSSGRLTNEGKQLISKVIDYLLSSEPASIKLPDLVITDFRIGNYVGKIDEPNDQIIVEVPYNDAESMKHVFPQITLQSSYTFVTPKQSAEDGSVDFSNWGYGVYYTVSDYINQRVYNVRVVLKEPEGFEQVYEPGEWVNIYDMQGRKLTTTNQDIYSMPLPAGVYIIATQNGTFKITK
ncbi:MAG: hypothetical protein II551_00780 [Paludibacteraceae bacterium]|nr:hypothetical protein [Paludibacteraceae bacterium]